MTTTQVLPSKRTPKQIWFDDKRSDIVKLEVKVDRRVATKEDYKTLSKFRRQLENAIVQEEERMIRLNV